VPPLEVPADVVRLEARRVHGRRLGLAAGNVQPHRLGLRRLHVQRPVHRLGLHRPLERPAQRVVVGRAGQADGRPQVRAVGQQRLGAAVTLLLVLAQRQAGKQLRLGERVRFEKRDRFEKLDRSVFPEMEVSRFSAPVSLLEMDLRKI
jgi:hypothetical protein